MLTYETLVNHLNNYLASKHPGVSIATDILEHGFLRLLGYPFVPEKCQFGDNGTYLTISLRTPYKIAVDDFISGLATCATGEFSKLYVTELEATSNQGGFCVSLQVPYTLIEANMSDILKSIDSILTDPVRKNFYSFWDGYAKKHRLGLTMVRIENLVNEKVKAYPTTALEIWTAIVKRNVGISKEADLENLQKEVAIDVNNFPKITLCYQVKGEIKKINLTRDQIVATLNEPGLEEFFYDKASQEFLIPDGIEQFVKNKYGRSFYVNEAGNFEIDLGYHFEEREILEKFGIKALSSYRPNEAAERTRYYIYDKENYLQALLALKEIKGEKCLDERLHQLTYYIRNEMWEKLTGELSFLLNLEIETGIKIDYTDLGLHLFDFAKTSLQEIAQEKTFAAIADVFEKVIEQNSAQTDSQKKIHVTLFELCLMAMHALPEGSSETEKLVLKEKLFIHSQKAGLSESNRYLGELAGLTFGNILNEDVTEDPLAVVLKLAAMHKATNDKLVQANDEVARLRKKIDQLKTASSLQEGAAQEDAISRQRYGHFHS